MDCVQYLVILLTLVAELVICNIGIPGRKVCYTDVGCFDPVNLFNLGIYVPDTPAEVGTKFQLYTAGTPKDNPTILNYLDNSTLEAFNSSKSKTFFIVHGIKGSTDSPRVILLKNAIQNKFQDVNVITVDWRNGSQYLINILRTASNTQLVGRQISRLVQLLSVLRNLNVKTVHLIGISMGAEACGFAGKWFKEIADNTIGRITALDAAGLWYQVQNTSYHIAKTDADFVDAIHTSAGQIPILGGIGILPPVGHVDFYPNGGRLQPQCTNPTDIFCAHFASEQYFAESVADTCPFTSNPCPGISNQLFGPLISNSCNRPCGNKCGRMGYYSDSAPGRGEQYLTTNLVSPYCKG